MELINRFLLLVALAAAAAGAFAVPGVGIADTRSSGKQVLNAPVGSGQSFYLDQEYTMSEHLQ